MRGLALIKLGGSIVTFKERAVAANEHSIAKICLALSQITSGAHRRPLIVVHGGGSFGHYWSVRYDMHTKPSAYDPLGVGIVHDSMVRLNEIIINNMLQKGIPAYSVPPSVFTRARVPIADRIKELAAMTASVVPVTFGDAVYTDAKNYSILSGDSIMTILAKALRPEKVIFVTNVDGIYEDLKSGKLVEEIITGSKSSDCAINFSNLSGADVTGGMQRKVTESQEIASLGIDVHIINGLEPQRIVDAVEGKKVVGTIVRRGSR